MTHKHHSSAFGLLKFRSTVPRQWLFPLQPHTSQPCSLFHTHTHTHASHFTISCHHLPRDEDVSRQVAFDCLRYFCESLWEFFLNDHLCLEKLGDLSDTPEASSNIDAQREREREKRDGERGVALLHFSSTLLHKCARGHVLVMHALACTRAKASNWVTCSSGGGTR